VIYQPAPFQSLDLAANESLPDSQPLPGDKFHFNHNFSIAIPQSQTVQPIFKNEPKNVTKETRMPFSRAARSTRGSHIPFESRRTD